MWKLQHLEGQREINELHIPVGRPVRLTMTSEDVIHSFFVPAFRTKQDVVPGPLHHHLVHAHQARQVSPVLRRVLRHQPFRHDRLGLRDGAAGLSELAERRRRRGLAWRRTARSCSSTSPAPTATRTTTRAAAPPWSASSASTVQLAGGGTVKADESLHPRIDPAAAGQSGRRLSSRSCPPSRAWSPKNSVLQLIEYVKSLGPKPGTGPAATGRSRQPRTPRALRPPIVRTI